ncbi:hypothetical protein IPC483_31445 [Pseudomonas aeruginosa]|nr:hypothetical protein IPC483_31445 [Pseudomonas aeruginosa]
MFSCSKIEQKQLNTWVSFQSAEQPLLGQFSVSGNMLHALRTLPVLPATATSPSPTLAIWSVLPQSMGP